MSVKDFVKNDSNQPHEDFDPVQADEVVKMVSQNLAEPVIR